MDRARLAHLLRHPGLIGHALWRRWYVRRHPDHPWWDPAAIEVLSQRLRPGMTAFEWGAGRSTMWLAARVGHLVSIEHDRGWHARVRARLDEAGVANVDLRLIETTERGADHWAETPYVMAVADMPASSLDLVVVDGLYRQHCVARSVPVIKPGGYLVVDNARQLPSPADWGAPGDWPLIHLSARRLRDTAIWQKPG